MQPQQQQPPPPSPQHLPQQQVPQQQVPQQQAWGYGIPFQGGMGTVSVPRHPHDTVSAARQLVAAVRSGTSAQPQPPPQQQWMPVPQPEPEPEPEPGGEYVDFTQVGTSNNYEPLMRTVSPPGGTGNYLGARRDVPLLPTISKLRDQMALGDEMGAGAEAGADEGGADTYQAKRNAIMRSMSISPPDPAEEVEGLSWEWNDLVQVAKYNAKGVRVGSQQQYLVVDGDKDGGATLFFYRSLEDRVAQRPPVRTLHAVDIRGVIVSGVRIGYAKGSMRLRAAPKWLSGLTAADREAMLTDSRELFEELCTYIKWRAANPVNHETVRHPAE